MSVWLPRSQQAAFVRSYSRQLIEARTTRYISLGPRTRLVSPHSTAYALILHRAQSTSTSSSAPTSRDATSKIVTNDSSALEPKAAPPAPKDPTSDAPFMTRAWKKVKHEAAHYWHGSKLLVSEVRISARLQWKILHGESLTRRERRQASISSLTLLTA
jgi:LETM1 and EF-hand domain-containing protein 1